MAAKRSGAVAAAAALLSGCTVGPPYAGPPRDIVARPAAAGRFASAADKAFVQAPLPDRWWHLYDDARLDRLVETALAANADLHVADANLRRALAVVRETEAERTPATTLSGGATYARSGGSVGGPPVAGYDVSGSVSYPLDLFGQIRRGIEAANASADATLAARDLVRLTVAAGVTRAYVGACAANRSYAATREILTIQQSTLNATERLFRGGRDTAFDVTRARAAVDQSAASLPAIVAERQAALFQLGALLGGPPADYPRDVATCAVPPTLHAPLPVGDGTVLIRRRPDVREAERTLAGAVATVGVNVAALYPQVSLGGSATSIAPFSTFASRNSFGFSLGPLLTWTFPNRAIVHAQIAEAGAAADADAASFDSTVIEALRSAETALSAYARQLDTVAALIRARDDANTAVQQADRLYLYGRVGFLDRLTAESTLATAQASLAEAQATADDDRVTVFQALGGGWSG